MSEQAAYSLADILLRNGIMELDILGGEPLLVPYMKDFLRYVTAAGVTVNISTNGSLPEVVHTLAKIPSQLLNIGFSVHGFAETHNAISGSGNFHSVIRGIRIAIGEGKSPVVKSVLTPQNREEIYGLMHYLGELGIKRYFLLHEDIVGREQQTGSFSFPEFVRCFSPLTSKLKDILCIGFVAASGFFKYGKGVKGRCDAGTTKLAVLPDGSIFPCNLFFGFREFYLGNILRDRIDTILYHQALERFRTFSGNACGFSDCNHYATCSGGCPAHSYSFYRDIQARDPRCRHHENNGNRRN